MDRARVTPPGRAISRAGGRSASATIRARDCWCVSTSVATSPGRSIRRPERHDARVAPAALRKEVETCGLCHARRAGFNEDWVPGQWLSQTHVVEPLARNTYHPDGQIRDVEEPYNYTPFKQSKMFAAGVTCSDCHEPHSAKLRALRRRRLPAMPCLRQIRRCKTSPPRQRRSAADVHVVPHAGPHLHGRRSQARSHLPRAAARSFGQARDTERLQRLPRRQVGAMGRRCRRRLVRPQSRGFSDLWGGVPCCAHRPGRRRRASCRRCRGSTMRRRLRVQARLPNSPLASRPRISARREPGLPIPIRWCGSVRWTCWKTFRPPRSGRWCRRFCPIRCAASVSGQRRCSPRFRPQASRRPIASASIKRQGSLSPRNAPTPRGRKPARRWRIFSRSADRPADAEAEYKAALQLSPQYVTAAINLADLYRQLGRDTEGERASARRNRGFTARRCGPPRARPCTDAG